MKLAILNYLRGSWKTIKCWSMVSKSWFVILSLFLFGCQRDQEPLAKPNVLVILADDMGYSDIGAYGSEIETPNLDGLAKGGALFTQFYNTSRCCPSRASLLTGLYSHQAGIGFMVADQGYPSYQGFLNDQCITLAEALKEVDYGTYAVGKWHVGTSKPNWPVKRGFDRFYGSSTAMGHYFGLMEGRDLIINDQQIKPNGEQRNLTNFSYTDIAREDGAEWYATDVYSDYAVQYIEDHISNSGDKPFFMYLAYTAPHWPLHALPEDIKKYENTYQVGWDEIRKSRLKRLKEMGILDEKVSLSPREDIEPWNSITNKDSVARSMAVYAAMIDRMDLGIGRVISTLEKNNQFDNTIIMFLSDNGGCPWGPVKSEPGSMVGEPESYEKLPLGWANANNTPFRLYKQYTHEGGISSPLIISYPNKIPEPKIIRQPTHIIDLFPTILEWAGSEYPETFKDQQLTPLEGKSLVSLVNNQPLKRDQPMFWEHRGHKAILMDNWKLVMGDGDWELYDINKDRAEQVNLISQYPEVAKTLKTRWMEWAKDRGVMDLKDGKLVPFD
ncbi:MAG: arylsulfatase [Cyclobacteriaceae bacterium]